MSTQENRRNFLQKCGLALGVGLGATLMANESEARDYGTRPGPEPRDCRPPRPEPEPRGCRPPRPEPEHRCPKPHRC